MQQKFGKISKIIFQKFFQQKKSEIFVFLGSFCHQDKIKKTKTKQKTNQQTNKQKQNKQTKNKINKQFRVVFHSFILREKRQSARETGFVLFCLFSCLFCLLLLLFFVAFKLRLQ